MLSHYLTYRIDPAAAMVEVERKPGEVLCTLYISDLRR